MEKNKTRKYFKYAIGEIVLVVLGILIALQINNWNTKNANEKEAYNQLLEVQKEILVNLPQINNQGDGYYERLRNVRRVFADTLDIKDYQKNPSIAQIMRGYGSLNFRTEAFNNLVKNADNLPEKYKPLIVKIKHLYDTELVQVTFKELFRLSSNYTDEFIQDYLASIYRSEQDDYYKFLLTSKDYKNKLAMYASHLRDISGDLISKKYFAIEIYKEMVALGFPDKGKSIIAKMYIDSNTENTKPFIGSYTNTKDTINIQFKNNHFFMNYTDSKRDFNLRLRDTSTINFNRRYFEFNNDKSIFYNVIQRNTSHQNWKKIELKDD